MKLPAIKSAFDAALKWSLIGLMMFTVLNITWQIATRFLLGDPSAWTEELARFLLIWIGLLGAAYLTGAREHLSMDVLVDHLGPGGKRVCRYAIDLAVLSFAGVVMIAGGGQLVYLSFELQQTSPAMQIPLGFVYSVIPLSGLLMVLYIVLDLGNSGQAEATASPQR